MKKISLKKLNLKEIDQLSREQLRDVLGGFADGSGSSSVTEDPDPKITACKGQSPGKSCSWTFEGNSYAGNCKSVPPSYILHCSDLY